MLLGIGQPEIIEKSSTFALLDFICSFLYWLNGRFHSREQSAIGDRPVPVNGGLQRSSASSTLAREVYCQPQTG